MSIEKKLKKLCGTSTEVKIVKIEMSEKTVEVLVPYEVGSIEIELEGDNEGEMLESFVEGVNRQLERMVNHLNDCKLMDID
ncbi:hypothetical protein AB4Z17_11635 [Paenibacillus sp. TAF43_2]|uniref:hypothetical protein n=1 Tax=Paenibacillus sp. TAF43_2 TaxID=3233069 RepID=UPI003F96E819